MELRAAIEEAGDCGAELDASKEGRAEEGADEVGEKRLMLPGFGEREAMAGAHVCAREGVDGDAGESEGDGDGGDVGSAWPKRRIGVGETRR